MKKLIFLSAILFVLLAASACKEEDVIFYAGTTLAAAETAGTVFNAAYVARCASGQATPEQCAKWESVYQKFTATLDTAKLALAEYEKLKGKPAEEKLRIILADLNTIVAQIRELIEAWKHKAAMNALGDLEHRLAVMHL